MQEFDLIYKYFYSLVAKSESLNLLDDCAVLSSFKNEKIIINVDTIVENRHFFSYKSKKSSAKSIANKLLGVNLSDLASMGAKPKYWTMSIALPSEYSNDIDWIKEFVKELKKIQKKYNFYLIGGDTTSSDSLVLTANIFGTSANKNILKQSNAKENDLICVSNNIGDSYWGLQLLNNNTEIQFLSKKDINLTCHQLSDLTG
jgi:thiamine-monophosphate kinase